MLLAPALSEAGADVIALDILKALIIVIMVLVGAKWIVPTVLHQVVRTRNRELFITTIMLFCIGIPVLTSKFGYHSHLEHFSRDSSSPIRNMHIRQSPILFH
jgi:CPA2 family monovalent cation:H+ antiporter-2